MPVYEYSCETCKTDFELFQSFSEDTLKTCPKASTGLGPKRCKSPGKGKVRKIFSAPSISFKGKGFYKTDSRSSSSNGSSPDKSKKESSKTSDKADSPSDKSADKKSPKTSKDSSSSGSSDKASGKSADSKV